MNRSIAQSLTIGVDIGGTFTDIVAAGHEGRLIALKVPSTPRDPSRAVLLGLEQILALAKADPSSVGRFVHGTTVATNAVLERTGARVGLLTTRGFRDVLEIGRLQRSNIYDLFLGPETPTFLVPRRRRFEIRERVGPSGDVVTPLDEDDVERAVTNLVERHGIEALAVCYLFSFRNPDHERRTRNICASRYPDLPVSLSSDVDPRFREYERLCTTVFDAYLRPVIGRYVRRIERGLGDGGVRANLFIMQSSGGLYRASDAVDRPVSTLKSGLAGGVAGACDVARKAGYEDIITVDIGGTSCDVALIRDGRPAVREESRLDTYPVRVPMVDVNTIGAGGGSIAWLDDAGGLHVGPRSAGADPGPACYGRGGTAPTVTDASVVLGYLNPANFAGGATPLDSEAAHAAIARLAGPLDLSVPETAFGIHRIVNAAMANEVRKVSLQRGHDCRRFTLVLLGGAGPVHGGQLATALGMTTVLVPALPGLLCAYGLLVSDVTYEHVAPVHALLGELDPVVLLERSRRLEEDGRALLRQQGAADPDIVVNYVAQMRYAGQSYEIDVEVPPGFDGMSLDVLRDAFHARHHAVYGREQRAREVELVGLRACYRWKQPAPSATRTPARGPGGLALKGCRRVYLPEDRVFREVHVYERALLTTGTELLGPAIIEQADTTTVVGSEYRVRVDALGNLIMGPRR